MKSAHIFSKDLPRVKPEEDELNRAAFCKEIARTLASWRSPETFVVSLSGPWGAGKTTLCNFVKHYLLETDPEARFVDFNPWEWSGQDKIFEGFFYQIGSLFGKTDKEKKTRRLLKRWEWLAVTLKAGSAIGEDLPRWVPGAIGLLTFAGLVGGAAAKNWSLTGTAGALASLALLSSLMALPEKLAAYIRGRQKIETLDDLRDEIAKELDELKRPIIVFVDDIDRLTDTEIALLFQLIKANVKLPNIVFFLMFQKNVVSKSIGKLISEDGDKYLRKIIQVEWDTPIPSEAQIMPLLLNGIDRVLNEGRQTIEWDKARWSSVFYEGVWPYFENLRDINRFLGSLCFYFRLQVKGNVLEVNPVDLVAIETLRSFDNDAYAAVARSSKWIQKLESPFRKTEALEELQKRFESIIEAKERSAEKKLALRITLTQLFPQAFGGSNDQDQFLRSLRICHQAHFHKYFSGVLDLDNAYASQWAEIKDGLSGQSKIASLINAAIETGRLEQFLTQLWAGKSEIPMTAMLPLTTALFDAGDSFPIGGLGIGLFDAETTCERFIRFRLITEDESERSELIKRALTDSTGFSLPIDFIAMEDSGARRRHPEIQFVVANANVRWIENHGLNLIRAKAEAGTLLEKEDSGFTLGRWESWGPEGEAKAWATKFASTPRSALVLLMRLAGRSTRGDGVSHPILSTGYLERYLPVEDLNALVSQLPNAELSDDENQHVALLKMAAELKKAGRPYAEIRLPGT